MTTLKPPRRWFTFTIREFMLLIALVATGVGWYVDHHRIKDLAPLISVLDQKINTDDVASDWESNGMGGIPGRHCSFSYRGRNFSVLVRQGSSRGVGGGGGFF
jgi:hypothetical protein